MNFRLDTTFRICLNSSSEIRGVTLLADALPGFIGPMVFPDWWCLVRWLISMANCSSILERSDSMVRIEWRMATVYSFIFSYTSWRRLWFCRMARVLLFFCLFYSTSESAWLFAFGFEGTFWDFYGIDYFFGGSIEGDFNFSYFFSSLTALKFAFWMTTSSLSWFFWGTFSSKFCSLSTFYAIWFPPNPKKSFWVSCLKSGKLSTFCSGPGA